jgi:hypothetical protein
MKKESINEEANPRLIELSIGDGLYLVGAGFLLDGETVFSGQVAAFRDGIVRLLKRHPQKAVIKVVHLKLDGMRGFV